MKSKPITLEIAGEWRWKFTGITPMEVLAISATFDEFKDGLGRLKNDFDEHHLSVLEGAGLIFCYHSAGAKNIDKCQITLDGMGVNLYEEYIKTIRAEVERSKLSDLENLQQLQINYLQMQISEFPAMREESKIVAKTANDSARSAWTANVLAIVAICVSVLSVIAMFLIATL